jgi:hypothetical protein
MTVLPGPFSSSPAANSSGLARSSCRATSRAKANFTGRSTSAESLSEAPASAASRLSDVFVARGVAVAGGIGVGCALDERVRRILHDQKTRLERVDRAWTHAAGGCSIDGVFAHALDRS